MSATPSDRIPFGGTHGINCEKTGGSQPCRCSPPSAPREADAWLSAVRWSATLWNNVENRDALNALAAQLPELGKARSRLAAAVARIEFLEAEEGRWDRVTDMAFICEAQAQCPHGMPVASKCLTCTNATLAEWAKDVVVLQQRTRLAEARAAAAEQRADAEVEIKEEMFDNWTKAERRLASLLEKVEHDEADYRRRAKETEWDERHANETAANALAAVRSLLVPSEDTSDGR